MAKIRRRKKAPDEPPSLPAPAPAAGGGRRSTVAVLSTVVALAATGLGVWTMRRPGLLPRNPGLSVLLISIDTLRADAVGAYGAVGAETPWIDRLATEGVRFETARAHNVVTLPSHANMLSGRYPVEHGVRDNSGFRFPTQTPTLATLLKARGFRTAGFVSAFVLDSRFGLNRGFDLYDDQVEGSQGRGAFLMPERSGPATVAAAMRWIEAGGHQPWFVFLHLYEPHAPYEPPEPFASRFRDAPYRGEVAAADAALEPLLRTLIDGQARRPTLVVLTSDHGEGLGEHNELTHGIFAYESTLRVPLVLHAGGLLAPRVVEQPVRHVDIVPTVLDLLGLDPPATLDGRSLLTLAVGRPLPGVDTYFEALSASLDRGWAPLHGIVSGGFKYVDLPIPELYQLDRDPRERTNLVGEQPAVRERLIGRLEPIRAADRGAARTSREDAATIERLRALGYAAGGASPAKDRHEPEDDPKALIALDHREAEILRLFRQGDLDGARALCIRSLADRPSMSLTWAQLASIERSRGDLEAAAEAARRALALRPLDPSTGMLLGGMLVEAGRPEEALRVLGPLLDAAGSEPDPDLLIAKGMALARLGRSSEALALFERVHRMNPGDSLALVNAGTVHLLTGDLARAARAFSSALEVDPRAARAHNGLGVIAARQARTVEAIEHWKRALAIEPRDYQTLFNLGSALRRAGRQTEARPYLEAFLQTAPPEMEGPDLARVRGWLAVPR